MSWARALARHAKFALAIISVGERWSLIASIQSLCLFNLLIYLAQRFDSLTILFVQLLAKQDHGERMFAVCRIIRRSGLCLIRVAVGVS